MSNLQLPTTGSLNWGSGLNAYIRHLENRVQTLEKNFGDQTISDVVENVAGACSGVISKFECTFIEGVISMSGTVYFSGDIRKIINIKEPKTYAPESRKNEIAKNIGFFVFLKYDSTKSGDEVEKLTIVLEKELKLAYDKILIGFYYNNDFVPFFYWDMKTITQHQYELTHIYNDLDENYISLTIDGGKVNRVDIGPTQCNVYCDGLSIPSNGTGDIYTSNVIEPYTLNIKENSDANKLIFLVDSLDTNNKIITKYSETVPSVNYVGSEDGNYYRILIDIFGNTYVQKASTDAHFNWDRYGADNILSNIRFGREFFYINDSKTYDYSFQSNLLMEVGRFGYNGLHSSIYYKGASYPDGFVYGDGLIYTRSVNDGVGGQPFLGIWDISEGNLYLDKLKFSGSSTNDYTDFTVYYDGENLHSNEFSAENLNSLDPSLVGITKYSQENGIFTLLEFKNSINKVTFNISGKNWYVEKNLGIGESMGSATSIERELCSETGKKYTVKLITGLQYIKLEFSGASSWEKDSEPSKLKIISIGASGVTIQIKNGYSLAAEPCILWTQSHTGKEGISLMNNQSQLVLPASSSQPLTISSDGILVRGKYDKTILSHTSAVGTELNIWSNENGRLEHKMFTDDGISSYEMNHYDANGVPKTIIRSEYDNKPTTTENKASLSLLSDKINVEGTIYMKESEQILFVSDARRKEKFEGIKDSYLSVVNKVPVLKYNYKNSSKNQVGILAQDLEKALDSLQECFINIQDTTELKSQRSLNENKLLYILWKALQEESSLRNKLEQKIEELEKRL